ncbi:MAG: uroporphyrinogen decarboxylase family protein [Chloroflexota bacterium]
MTTLTPRERVWQSIRHQQTDIVPYHIICTIPAVEKLVAYYGSNDLDTILNNHIVKYRLRLSDVEITPGRWRDGFDLIWNRSIDRDIGVVENYPLKERSLKDAHFPDPLDPHIYQGLQKFIDANPTRFRMASVGFALFERAWSLRTMEELLVDMIEAPDFVNELFDAITEYDLAMVNEAVKYDIDAILFGDDWGQQTGLIFGARLWRKFIKPRIARLYSAVKQSGKAVFIHTCGKVQELFPELIDLGLDVFNPFQPEVMDVYEMKRLYGKSLSFYGGVSIQQTLPFGTPQQVRDEVRRLMDEIGKDGGYICAPSHAMPDDIPLENMLAFIETVQSQ